MAHKELKYDQEARAALEAGVDAVANAVKVTLGPKGRYVVLDVARRQVCHPLHVHGVDHCVEDLLSRRVLEPDRHHHHVALLVLGALVAEPDRRCLTASLQLVYEDRRIEVEDVHGGGDYLSAVKRDSAASAISRSPL